MADKIFNKFKDQLVKAVYDWTSVGKTFRVILVDSTSTYAPNDTHNFAADFFSNGGVELSTTNYVGGYGGAGRKAIAGRAVTRDDATLHGEKLTASNLTWTALGPASAGPTIKAILIVEDVTSDAASPLVAYLDSAGNLATNGGDVTLTWGANGVMTLT